MTKLSPANLSTADLARLFDVTETTIKRWADSGELPCIKTPGGHRKYLLSAVLAFADARGFSPSHLPRTIDTEILDEQNEQAVIHKDIDTLRNTFVQKVLSGKPGEVSSFLLALSHSNLSVVKLCDEIIDPGMEEVGNLWLTGKLGVETEHRVSYEVLNAISQIESAKQLREPTGRTVLLACPRNEHHEIGLRSLAAILRLQGWNIIYLGANVPTDSLMDTIRIYAPEVVCLSMTDPEAGLQMQNDLRKIYESVRYAKGTLVLGGTGVHQRFRDARLCDHVCESARDFLALSHRLA
ncbi:MAG: cobalamin-dependent protein [Ignavibacteria bacterium]|nr:cobalamin-dependent protein [Ignavibacteria bacterium]